MTSHPEFTRETSAYTVTSTFSASVKDKVILITGVNNAGLGGMTAKALAAQSPKLLILTGRSTAKVDIVSAAIAAAHPTVTCKSVACELSSLAAVRTAAAEIAAAAGDLAIDIVVNNAGIMALPEREISADGNELQFATNHLGHFLLTNLLMPKILAAADKAKATTTTAGEGESEGAPPVRIINVASFGHNFSPVRFADLKFETPLSQLDEASQPSRATFAALGLNLTPEETYNQATAYGNSKTANILFTLGLNKRLLRSRGVASFALHPGAIETELARHMDPAAVAEMASHAGATFRYKTLEQGAATHLVAALDPGLKASGVDVYLSDCQVTDAAPWARDEEAAEKLWAVSEELVGQKFEY